jgi:hypothetical protein
MNQYLLFAMCVVMLSGCSSIPKNAFLLTPSTPDDRQMESRVFATRDEPLLIKDGAVILENMGYKTDLVNPDIGLVTATKHEGNGGFASMMMSVLSAGLASSDKDTMTRATFTTMPAKGRQGAFITRLTLQQIVLDSNGEASSITTITDKDTYKIFYERLEASTFIEPDRI